MSSIIAVLIGILIGFSIHDYIINLIKPNEFEAFNKQRIENLQRLADYNKTDFGRLNMILIDINEIIESETLSRDLKNYAVRVSKSIELTIKTLIK